MSEKSVGGFNIQMQKQTDIAGGVESVLITTYLPEESSEQAIYDRIKKMGAALQKRIAQQSEAEDRRQQAERARQPLTPAQQTPVPLYAVPKDNGAVEEQ